MSEQPDEIFNILDREGAITALRNIRRDIKAASEGIGSTEFTLAATVKQMGYLKLVAEQTNAQLFALSVVVARMLDDPLLEAEIAADLEVLDAEQTP